MGRTSLKFGAEPGSEVGLQIQLSHSKQINKTRFQAVMAEGSEALLKNVNKVAISSYRKTLDVIALADDLKVSKNCKILQFTHKI